MPSINSGDIIFVPQYNKDAPRTTVKWQQSFVSREAEYILVIAKNQTTGQDVPFFIAAEYYKPKESDRAEHITRIAQSTDDNSGYKLQVDNRIQYGQKNDSGENRFAVYHDKNRKPYQLRFAETTFLSSASQYVLKFGDALQFAANGFGYGSKEKETHFYDDFAKTGVEFINAFAGQPLRGF